MLYVIIEYIVNVEVDVCIFELMCVFNDVLIGYVNVFFVGGICMCVLWFDQYCMVDGVEDDVFIYVIFCIKVGW